MPSRAFLLGLYSVGGQTLLLRELTASFGGDDLLIGSALFGWLAAVALGAWWGGRPNVRLSADSLFVTGAVLLPVMVVTARLTPLAVLDIPTEMMTYANSTMLSIVLMTPVAFVSGWLFPAISRRGWLPAEATVRVYLWEGVGAFVGGAAVTMLAGSCLSTLALAGALAIATIATVTLERRKWSTGGAAALAVSGLILMAVCGPASRPIDRSLAGLRYPGYEVVADFDTHCSRQTILTREGQTTLITDGATEDNLPALESAENFLIPPLLLKPEAKRILLIGRAEFGVMQLAARLPGVEITAVDPRSILSHELNKVLGFDGSVTRVDSDPATFFMRRGETELFDVVIIGSGPPDNYRAAALVNARFLTRIRLLMDKGGLLAIPLEYDTDRYISEETEAIVATIQATIGAAFPYVSAWPGDNTVVFASSTAIPEMDSDSVEAALARLSYAPSHLDASRLADRLRGLKRDRLREAMTAGGEVHDLTHPRLARLHAIYRSGLAGERAAITSILANPLWLLIPGGAFLGLLTCGLLGMPSRRRLSRLLFFVAGAVSLTAELVAFYLYQSLAGSLYSELALLVGSFMLGMASGAGLALRLERRALELPSLATLGLAVIALLLTYDSIDPRILLFYLCSFLYVTAMATGALFAAASEMYCGDSFTVNRGSGYAWELAGSAVAALLTLTVLLPTFGLEATLWTMVVMVALSLGATITRARFR